MNEPTQSIWKRPWQSPRALLIWLGLLAAATFIIIVSFGLLAGTGKNEGLAPFALVASVVVSIVVTVGVLFIRWLCCWRNLRRLAFVLVCLATLIALVIAEENWRGKSNWEKAREQYEANGEKFTIAALLPPQVPDDKNLALTPLLKPLLDYTQAPGGGAVVWADTNGQARLRNLSAYLAPHRDTNDQVILGNLEKGTFADLLACAAFYRGNTNYPQAPATATPAETILVALGKFRPELDQLREAAAARPYCRFPVHYETEPPWVILLPHLASVKALVQLLHVHALAELEAGHPAEAFEDLQLGQRFSQSLREEPLLIDHLVRIAALAIDLQTVREGLVRHAWNDVQLTSIETNLAPINLLAEHKVAMRGEQACEIEGLNYLRRQGWRSNPFDYVDSAGNSGPSFFLFPSGWYYQNMLTICRLMHEFSFPAVDETARRVFPDITARGAQTFTNMPTRPYNIFAKMVLPAFSRAAERSARSQTYVDAAHMACALERYRLANGNLPDSLETLVPKFLERIPNDVIDGKPLRYRKSPDGGYLLYSIGWNQTDDGGKLWWVKDKKESRVDSTKGDWVWIMPK